jgi:hypothetical protein
VIPPLSVRLADETAERVRQSHARAITDLQRRLEAKVVRAVVLPDGVRTSVSHDLGREPLWIGPSAIRGSVTVGCVVEFRDGVDRVQRVDIAASGYGATVTIDLLVIG